MFGSCSVFHFEFGKKMWIHFGEYGRLNTVYLRNAAYYGVPRLLANPPPFPLSDGKTPSFYGYVGPGCLVCSLIMKPIYLFCCQSAFHFLASSFLLPTERWTVRSIDSKLSVHPPERKRFSWTKSARFMRRSVYTLWGAQFSSLRSDWMTMSSALFGRLSGACLRKNVDENRARLVYYHRKCRYLWL